MRNIFLKILAAAIALSIMGICFADEVVMKTRQDKYGNIEQSFYENGKWLATQITDGISEINSTGKIPDGLVREYYLNGNLKIQKYYKNGIEDGEYIGFYENGKVEFKGRFKQGTNDGVCLEYYENGVVAAEMNYNNGNLNGDWNEYYGDGSIKTKKTFKDGKQHGIFTTHDKSGRLVDHMSYADGKVLFGTRKEYYENGLTKYMDSYRNGVKISRRAYEENGNLKFTKNY
ncbi:MAG: hypothetical protein DKM50_01735 [Candidatus Margulisiibacteriota bacterium]|nr:MAG: hypothetical protein A2X43_13410 [Candidatus Margulisbacteria bacterium GWD2_39_127]OGI04745.1 MAG: hypothetical protein A2X42_10585 [Candidatus Margulisbacteria bacterium GWF2_38_17]OGI05690.1 MAG: hypothetical protein A2X41_03170 [Candidatus Margulisbacteria bacterium GWE2_39_32]PZM83624.1 MAG: hypothetical protein DKM50_01735 [Candidatus Margulisiibacteriota bacterium]HAR62042.1 hypothetical protein [Candidatus Margulisiibacteriota bacterium]